MNSKLFIALFSLSALTFLQIDSVEARNAVGHSVSEGGIKSAEIQIQPKPAAMKTSVLGSEGSAIILSEEPDTVVLQTFNVPKNSRFCGVLKDSNPFEAIQNCGEVDSNGTVTVQIGGNGNNVSLGGPEIIQVVGSTTLDKPVFTNEDPGYGSIEFEVLGPMEPGQGLIK